MDDFNITSLKESRNEWCVRLINILTPQIILGIRSIFNSAKALCVENGEMDKYLLTFQNFLTRIPKWNNDLIQQERDRICEASGCKYLEDLITCVHIIQLKMLTSIRVGNKQKKVDLSIPKLDDFIHKAYILVARQMYNKAYLFSLDVKPIEQQKNNTEIEAIIQKCILDAVRESIPLEYILRSYLEETEEVVDEVKEEIIKETIKPIKPETVEKESKDSHKREPKSSALGFSNIPSSIPTPFDDLTTHKEGGSSLNPVTGSISTIPEVDHLLPPMPPPSPSPSSYQESPSSISVDLSPVNDFGMVETDFDITNLEDSEMELNI
jgi:hypothetical protein